MSAVTRAERGERVLRAAALGALLGVGAVAALGLWLIIVGTEKAYESLEKKEAK